MTTAGSTRTLESKKKGGGAGAPGQRPRRGAHQNTKLPVAGVVIRERVAIQRSDRHSVEHQRGQGDMARLLVAGSCHSRLVPIGKVCPENPAVRN